MQPFLSKTTALLFALGCFSALQAQDQPPTIWEERAKEPLQANRIEREGSD